MGNQQGVKLPTLIQLQFEEYIKCLENKKCIYCGSNGMRTYGTLIFHRFKIRVCFYHTDKFEGLVNLVEHLEKTLKYPKFALAPRVREGTKQKNKEVSE